jgi:hypothetical protein
MSIRQKKIDVTHGPDDSNWATDFAWQFYFLLAVVAHSPRMKRMDTDWMDLFMESILQALQNTSLSSSSVVFIP